MQTILQLSGEQLRLYELLCRELCKGSYKIGLPLSFPMHNSALVSQMVKLALGDHPELIRYNNCQISIEGLMGFGALRLQPAFDPREAPAAQARFEAETRRILREVIRPGTNAIQRALAIHDYLSGSVVYDAESLNARVPYIHSHTAYGAIVEKKAVCEGISYAFCHLAKRAGLDVTVVNGVAKNEDHAWNMIRLGRECYHVDVTWDLRNRSGRPMKVYDYFCLRDADLKNRQWDKTLYPPCNSSRFNYFEVTDSFAHDRDRLREIMLRQYRKYGAVYLRYDFISLHGREATDYFFRELCDLAGQHRLPVGPVSMSLNEDLGVFALFARQGM